MLQYETDPLRREEFLSEEELSFGSLPWAERIAYWNQWLEQAAQWDDADPEEYSHGVFVSPKEARRLLEQDT